MEKFLIKGSSSKGVKGLINCSGAKNAVLPLMASSILFDNTVTLTNVPIGASDVQTMIILLKSLGSKVQTITKKKVLKITNLKKHKLLVKYKYISTMRAGVLAMGALLGKYNKCSTALSGGCSLGPRPIGYHLAGFKKLNCKYSLNKGYINIIAPFGIKGGYFRFPKVSVTGTSNLILASVLASGTTTLKNISIEPEVLDLIKFLKNGGARIYNTGKRTIKIYGVKKLNGHQHEVIGDRIEAFSYLCAAAITKGKGWQGVIYRWGAKRKQHKSRKTVREIGSLGPISPQSVMYTVPRAGQTGFHQRVEYDKRIMIMSNTEKEEYKINPDGGFKHFGNVTGDFIIVKGSVPGTYRRLIKLRKQIRNEPKKVVKPNVLEVVI